ncbi:YbaK/EbsC family protein [Nocardioides marmoribigeumensis]|uniref:Prolyl-tRNA editing enzyme YbaK/EbsC (Cys-tRNA(Pro) deacylase) n=1 Tax=Nocardioides marmoribigeumensis TaxID=433649 RepID=A0ABU2BWH4_9ACTN|nr:YbaK/EbsC family protein [Nocardioides marmoribigeumensis]MDR7362706.1 prolyl-tRNA editing enzyme YbaK/EbsC (Cys-tRNA(Pro) deacylase) [Nocardioides marmoribigeumensis]
MGDGRWRLGRADGVPAVERTDLLADPVATALRSWDRAGEAGVIEIDPALADTATLSEAYDLPMEAGGNCVVVMGRRDGEERFAACVVRADTRADVNNLVKRRLDVRKCSFLAVDRATAESGMEHGGITPLGLPAAWRVLVDAALLEQPLVVLGSGVRRSKLLLPGPVLAELPGAEVVEGLGV